MMQSFFVSQWCLSWFSKPWIHQNIHRQPSCRPTPLPAAILWDEPVHLGCWLCSKESWLWQKASTHHVTVWYSNPLSPHFLRTTPTIPTTMTTSHLSCDPGVMIQFADMLGCDITRRRLSWLYTRSVVLQARHWQHTPATWSASYTLRKWSL